MSSDYIKSASCNLQPEHVSGAENGAERAKNRVKRAWQKTMERSWERAELAAHGPLQPNISLTL